MVVKIKTSVGGRQMEQGSLEQAAQSKPLGVRDASSSTFLELGAKIFMGPAGARVVAVAACYNREGTTHVCRALHSFLTRDLHLNVTLVNAENFLGSEAFAELAYERSMPGVDLSSGSSDTNSSLQKPIVLIDCPALLSSATALRLAPYVDGILLVVKDGARTKTDIQRAISMVETVQGRVLGAILNLRRPELPAWLYSLVS